MSKKILILSNNETMRESLRVILCDHYDLILLEPIEQNLYIIEKAKDLALFIIDIQNLPSLEPSLAQRIQKTHQAAPLLLIQGPKGIANEADFSHLNIKGLLQRPFQAETILKSVRQYV